MLRLSDSYNQIRGEFPETFPDIIDTLQQKLCAILAGALKAAGSTAKVTWIKAEYRDYIGCLLNGVREGRVIVKAEIGAEENDDFTSAFGNGGIVVRWDSCGQRGELGR